MFLIIETYIIMDVNELFSGKKKLKKILSKKFEIEL